MIERKRPNKLRMWLNEAMDIVKIALICALFLGLIYLAVSLKYEACRQKYPSASPWVCIVNP